MGHMHAIRDVSLGKSIANGIGPDHRESGPGCLRRQRNINTDHFHSQGALHFQGNTPAGAADIQHPPDRQRITPDRPNDRVCIADQPVKSR